MTWQRIFLVFDGKSAVDVWEARREKKVLLFFCFDTPNVLTTLQTVQIYNNSIYSNSDRHELNIEIHRRLVVRSALASF